MDIEMNAEEEMSASLEEASVRLAIAAQALEQAVERLAGITLEGSLERVSAREAALEERLSEAEANIASLRAEKTRGRKTEPAGVTSLVAREGRTAEPGALDAVLQSLSVEQRILVKSEMLRAGLIG